MIESGAQGSTVSHQQGPAMPGEISLKKALLRALYQAYDEIADRFESACVRQCSACCTHNVIATSLEVLLIIDSADRDLKGKLFAQALTAQSARILRPTIAVNDLARHCLERREPPGDEQSYAMGPCPFRTDTGCPIYENRPFGCRALWSSVLCDRRGHAQMHPRLLTLNSVFQQILEQIDRGGFTGNLLDVLHYLKNDDWYRSYRSGERALQAVHLLSNAPNPGFVVPPEHRREVADTLSRLWQRPVAGRPFREVLADIESKERHATDGAG